MTPLPVSLAISTLAWWLASRALGLAVPDLGGGRRAALATVGATLVGVPAGWLADEAFAYPAVTGWMLLALGTASGAGGLALMVAKSRRRE